MLTVVSGLAALWWSCSIAVLILSAGGALLHPLRDRRVALAGGWPAVTAIVPIKLLDPGFEEAQRSLFAQGYPGLEIVIVSGERDSDAVRTAAHIQADFPSVPSRILESSVRSAVSPKLNNMWDAIAEARNDLILTKDSNIRLGPDDLADLVRHMAPGVGLVSAISIVTRPQSLAAWIDAAIINCYHARVLMLADAMGLGFGLGKIMLFRASDVARAGGLERVAWALGEDSALSEALAGIGLKTVLGRHVCCRELGRSTFSEIWERHLRWMLIWRLQVPAAFFAALLGSAIPTAAAGAVAAPLIGLRPWPVCLVTLATWFAIESLLCIAKGWPVSLWSPMAFIGREIFSLAVWVRAWTTDKVSWAGAVHRARRSPPATASAVSSARSTCRLDR